MTHAIRVTLSEAAAALGEAAALLRETAAALAGTDDAELAARDASDVVELPAVDVVHAVKLGSAWAVCGARQPRERQTLSAARVTCGTCARLLEVAGRRRRATVLPEARR